MDADTAAMKYVATNAASTAIGHRHKSEAAAKATVSATQTPGTRCRLEAGRRCFRMTATFQKPYW